MDFYKDMLTCCSLNNIFDDDAYIEQYQTDIKYYKDEIDRLNSTLQTLLSDWERLISAKRQRNRHYNKAVFTRSQLVRGGDKIIYLPQAVLQTSKLGARQARRSDRIRR